MDLETLIGYANCVARLDRNKPACVKAYPAGNSQVNILCTVTSDEEYYPYPKPCQKGVVVGSDTGMTSQTGCLIETSQPVHIVLWESLDTLSV